MTEGKALALTGGQKQAVTNYTGTLFSDINFTDLNNIIERIATTKEELTDGMRDAASEFISDWDNVVIHRLDQKKDRIDQLLSFFNSRSKNDNQIDLIMGGKDGYYSVEPIAPYVIDLLNRTEDSAPFATELISLKEEWEDLKIERDDVPVRDNYIDPSMSYDEVIVGEKEYDLASAKHSKEVGRKIFAFRVKYNDFQKRLLQVETVKKLVVLLKKELKDSKKAVDVVHEKGRLAKLAINFGGTELLKALQDIHEFQKTL